MSATTKNEVNAFERTLAASHSFVGKLDRARQIISGYQGFISKMEEEIRLVQGMITQHDHLDLEHEGNNLREKYKRPLLAEAAQLGAMVEAARDILKEVDSSNKIRRLTDQRFKVISQRINDLLMEEQRRRISNLRVLGPKVLTRETKLEQSSLSRAALAEAYVRLVELIAQSQLDPHSKLTGLDAWFEKEEEKDFSIWLYHHSKDQKWKCLFFKLAITRIAEDLKLTLEAYVPFGLIGDPANYEMESSDVFARDGWRLSEALTKGLNQSRSFNLNVSSAIALGTTESNSITNTDGTSVTSGQTTTKSLTKGTNSGGSRAVGDSSGITDSKGKSVAHSSSWFDNWSESAGYSSNWGSSSQGTNFGGGNSNNQSQGGGQSGGTTQTDSINRAESFTNTVTDTTSFGDSESNTDADAISTTQGSNSSKSIQNQTGQSDTRTTTKAAGITMGDGESIQISFRAFGIALGKPAAEHLEKWREANADASRVYDSVVSAFETWGNRIGATLRIMSRGGGRIGSGNLEQRLPEIARFMPLENLTLGDLTLHQQGGGVNSIAEVVQPLARHGKYGLEHLDPPASEKEPYAQVEEIAPGLVVPSANPKSIVPLKL